VNFKKLMTKDCQKQSKPGIYTAIQFLVCSIVAFHGVYNCYMYNRFWEPTYEDVLNLIARLPPVASYVYRR
jgi:hypothetical protein